MKMSDENLQIGDLKSVPSAGLSDEDINKYDGTRVRVARVYVDYQESRYEDGSELPEGQTVKVPFAFVETEPIGQDALGQPIAVTERFPLKRNPTSGEWGPSLHQKSKSKKFFDLLKINKFEESVGREVAVLKRLSGTGRAFLGVNTG